MVLLAPYMKEIRQMTTFTVEALLCNELVTHTQFGKAENVATLWRKSTMEMAYMLGSKQMCAGELRLLLEKLLSKFEYHLEKTIRTAIHNSLQERQNESLHSQILR